MKLDVKEIQEAWKIVDQVDNASGLLSSQFIKLDLKGSMLTLHLSGLCVGLATCPVAEPKEDWTWYVDRRVIGAFLNSTKAKAKAVSVDKVGDALVWRAGRQKITAAAIEPVTGYASWEAKGAKLVLTDSLRADVALHASYAPTDDNLAAVVLAKGYGTLASDSFAVSAVLDKSQPTSLKLPTLLSKMLGTSGNAHALVDKDGAGVKYPNGYLYQSLPTNCVTGYPLKKFSQVLNDRISAKPALKIKAKALVDALVHLRGYVFGGAEEALVICSQGKPGIVSLKLDVAQGSVQTSAEGEWTADFKLSWPLARLQPWAERAALISPDLPVSCGNKDGCLVFTAKDKTSLRVLVVAETA